MAVESSFPAIHVTGPVHWFVRTPAYTANPAKIWYLGTCQTKPQMKVEKLSLDVFNDLGGRKKPFNSIDQGETGLVGLALNRYSKVALDAMQNAGGYDSGFGVGVKNSLAVGALQFGTQTVELWALYPFYGTVNAPLGSAGIPKGRYFPVAKIEAVEDVEIGTTENLKLIAFSMQNLWGGVPSGGGAYPLGFKCYSERTEDFPADVALANVQ